MAGSTIFLAAFLQDCLEASKDLLRNPLRPALGTHGVFQLPVSRTPCFSAVRGMERISATMVSRFGRRGLYTTDEELAVVPFRGRGAGAEDCLRWELGSRLRRDREGS